MPAATAVLTGAAITGMPERAIITRITANMLRSAVVSVALLLLSIDPALAGWQWTHWQMTQAEVQKAAQRQGLTLIEAAESRPDQVELDTTYTTMNMPFQV